MDCNSSERWHEHEHGWHEHDWHEHGWYGHHHHGNFWIPALIIFGLIILTHGWIIVLPLILFAAFAFFGFVLPRIMWHMQGNWQGGWGGWQQGEGRGGDWSKWAAWRDEKRKQHFGDWNQWNSGRSNERWGNWQSSGRGENRTSDEKPKRNNPDDIEYV
jgi:hypothetical protein